MTRRLAPVPDTPPRAVLYLRQSTYREESISLELQETAGRQYAARQGYTVVDVLADPGVTGRTWNRPAVQRAMAMLEQGEAEVIVLWRWSRLSRNRRDWALAADRADVAGGRIESATEPNDPTAAGRFARGVMTELAAFESERISEQWREVHASRIARGLPVSGRARFGYVRDPETGGFSPDPVTGPVLADLYARYLGGAGLVALTRHLHDLGLGSPYSGKPYSHRGVATLLDSGFGAGLLRVGGQYLSGAHEPVIDEATWRRYLSERERRTTLPPRLRAGAPSRVSGVARCATCGSTLALQRYARSGAKPRMRCSRLECAARVSVTVERVEAAVLEWLPNVAEAVERSAAAAAARNVDDRLAVARAQAVVEETSQALTRLALSHARGLIPQEAFVAARDELVSERDEAQGVLERVERRTAAGAELVGMASSLIEAWQSIAPEAAARMLRELVVVRARKHPDGTTTLALEPAFEE